jgi:ATP-dependent Clp protease ATP-binding subunit ClpC
MSHQGTELEVTQDVRELLAQEGFDPQFGARPLRRAIQRLIEDPLAEEILLGRFASGDTIRVEVEDGKMFFTKSADLSALPVESQS